MSDIAVSANTGPQSWLERHPEAGSRQAAAARALGRQLEGLRDVIAALPDSVYRAAPSRVSGSIGAHVRHCLDYVRALVGHRIGMDMSYDARLRGTMVETEPLAAVEEIHRLCLELEDIDEDGLDRHVRLWTLTERHGAPIRVLTTIGRELAFVIQHTIHHAAIVGVLLDQAGVTVSGDFGYAPSTPVNVERRMNSQLPTSNSRNENHSMGPR